MDYSGIKYEDQKDEVREIIEKFRSQPCISDEQRRQIYSLLSREKCIVLAEKQPLHQVEDNRVFISVAFLDIILDIISLQSLDLSGTQLRELPESITKLESLQSLYLSYSDLRELPESIGELGSLQGLYLSGTHLRELPENITKLGSLQSLELSGTHLRELPESIGELGSLQRLNLSRTQLRELPESITKLGSLQSLNLSYSDLRELPESITKLGSLQSLYLSESQLSELPESIGELGSLQNLDLSRTQLRELPESITKLGSLQRLDLSRTQLSELPESIGELGSLQILYLSESQLSELPESVGELGSLQSLYLSYTQLSELPESVGELGSLRILDLSGTHLRELPESITKLGSLQRLDLSRTQLSELPESIGELGSLQILYLSESQLSELPESVGELGSLYSLDLSGTQLRELPKSITKLGSLQRLDLSRTQLRELPESCLDIGPFVSEEITIPLRKHVNIYGISLLTQPASLFTKPVELVRDYYCSEKTAVNTTKMIILGQGGAGKTYTLARLLNGGAKQDYKTEMTPGVDIEEYHAKTMDGRSFTLHFWDFGGQEVMHSMHRCFLTERTCYLVIVDNRRADMDMMAQARYWLNNIASFAPHSPVMVMANMWDDDVYRGDLDEGRLHREFDQYLDIKSFVNISAKNASQEEFKKEIIERIIDISGSMVSLDMQLPVKWNNIRKELLELGKDNTNYYISQEDYYKLCERSGVGDRDIQFWLLDWFNDLGECFSYFKKDDEEHAEEYKVLNPQWITNAIYILITKGYKHVDQKRSPGVIHMSSVREMLKNAEGGTVDYIKGYKPEECRYIVNVMQKFELAYPVSEDGEFLFIPALLPKSEPENFRPAEYKQLVRYEMRYRFLPVNILQKLMVRYYSELELSACWDKGMALKNEALDQWALLDMGGGDDVLRIEVYTKGEYAASAMLNLMISRMDEVNNSLSLKPEHYIIIDDENEKPVEVNKLLNLKKRGYKQYQGDHSDFNIDVLLGNSFGNILFIAEKQQASIKTDVINTDLLVPAINNLMGDERYMDSIPKLDISGRPVLLISNSIINNNPVSVNQTIHGDITVENSVSDDVIKLAELLGNNLPVLTSAIAEIATTNDNMASDLRDINVELTRSMLKKEEKKPLERLIQFLSTSDNVVTIGQALLAVCTKSDVIDQVLELLQSIVK